MSATRTRSRPRKPDEARLNCSIKALVTRSELTAVDLLATDVYQGRSDLIAHALAHLIRSKHPEMSRYLRSGLE